MAAEAFGNVFRIDIHNVKGRSGMMQCPGVLGVFLQDALASKGEVEIEIRKPLPASASLACSPALERPQIVWWSR